MKKLFLFSTIGLVVAAGILFFRKTDNSEAEKPVSELQRTVEHKKEAFGELKASSQYSEDSSQSIRSTSEINHKKDDQIAQKSLLKSSNDSKNLVTYTIDGGVAVTQGDIIIGELDPEAAMAPTSGQVPEPQVKTWPTNEIPYFIQADLPNKERVIEALQMFSGTRVRFIPYNNHSDAIVFERREGVCKSYVGYIGGLQKVYLSDQCGPAEVAHEIMHSLGFVHEQNRHDRDQFIHIFWDNIEPAEKVNFEKFSGSAMKATGAASFDFQSIMMYPETMFSRNQSPTMRPVADGQKIMPSEVLSPKDVERINAIY